MTGCGRARIRGKAPNAAGLLRRWGAVLLCVRCVRCVLAVLCGAPCPPCPPCPRHHEDTGHEGRLHIVHTVYCPPRRLPCVATIRYLPAHPCTYMQSQGKPKHTITSRRHRGAARAAAQPSGRRLTRSLIAAMRSHRTKPTRRNAKGGEVPSRWVPRGLTEDTGSGAARSMQRLGCSRSGLQDVPARAYAASYCGRLAAQKQAQSRAG